jgi:hypothetical protein
MAPEPSPAEQFDRIKKQLQDSILKDYPNPDRVGCPGVAVLKELAARPLDDNLEGHAEWHHVTHCSECYREFLGFRAELRRKTKRRQAVVRSALVTTTVVIVAVVFFSVRQTTSHGLNGNQIAQTTFTPRIVDLEGRSIARSEQSTEETKPLLLERAPLDLTIRLPFGSKAGTYEVRLLRTVDQPLLSVTAQAVIQNGITELRTKVDLSKFAPGSYFIGIRRVPWDWTYYQVMIQ